MTNVNKIHELSVLAEASYALFDKINLSKTDQIETLLTGKYVEGVSPSEASKLSKPQASEFIANYQIVSHQPNTESGFSATVFKRKHPKEGEAPYIFANRGTEASDMVDVSVDVADIALNGLAV